MADGARLGSAVMFVTDLGRSVSFYTAVLGLAVVDRSPTAALLISGTGTQLILRAMGSRAYRPLGSVGLQYTIWTAAGQADLERCERELRSRSAHRETRTGGGVVVVEGHDPDDVVVMIAYPGPGEKPLHELPARIYGW
jgi:catechol 2,3-dioxygenase-like lactoylglutathione lyase family enzyme